MTSPRRASATTRKMPPQVYEYNAKGRKNYVRVRKTKKPADGELLGYCAVPKCVLNRETLILKNSFTKYYGEISTISVSESNIFLKPL